jgi:Cu+-exporting ATPase
MTSNTIKREIQLSIKGMTCGHCAMNVTKALQEFDAQHIKVDHSKGIASIYTEPNTVCKIIKKLDALGYPTKLIDNSTRQNALVKTLEFKFLISLILTLPLMAHMIFNNHFWHNQWLHLILSTPVVLIGFFHFGLSALGSLKRGHLNMDVLIFLGSLSAFLYSLVGTLFSLGPDYLFYETAAAIVTFVLLGNLLEKTALAKTTRAIEDLHALRPKTARLLLENQQTENATLEDLKESDLILVHAGETIPADGIIESGVAEIDESMLTGESSPVTREHGAKVIGSTILIKGPITVRVSHVGEGSILFSIIKLVEKALSERPSIHVFADKVSGIFVPLILFISIITIWISLSYLELSFGQSLLRSIAVLVIACPCAMGLATPTAVAVSVGKAAKMGILVRSGKALETLTKVRTVIFDKTGTLTTGGFKIKKIEPFTLSSNEIKSIIFSLEENSSHPIAKSIVRELKGTPKIELKNIVEERGVGVSAVDINNRKYKIQGDNTSSALTLVIDDKICGKIFIEDEIRPEAYQTIQTLKSKGIKTILLSGDSREKCVFAAKELGIDEFFAQTTPEQKLIKIREISSNEPTAFIGDGINDAPALAAATVGISLSSATDVAVNSAQLVLLNNDLSAINRAFSSAQNTLRAIKQNLFWALAYNIIAVPLAALGYMSPNLAAFSMAFSDVIVIGNSLRLKLQKS